MYTRGCRGCRGCGGVGGGATVNIRGKGRDNVELWNEFCLKNSVKACPEPNGTTRIKHKNQRRIIRGKL